jgi:HK97 gp10 family phage protein
VYKRKSVIHKASAPGEAPANDTGRLAGSISTYLNSTALESIVTAGRGLAKYATMLEFGTRKIKPRPFMFPALEKNKAWIANRLNDAMQKALKK